MLLEPHLLPVALLLIEPSCVPLNSQETFKNLEGLGKRSTILGRLIRSSAIFTFLKTAHCFEDRVLMYTHMHCHKKQKEKMTIQRDTDCIILALSC